jgi:copper chaperone
MQETLTLSIEGMHCGGCVRRVTAALQAVKGVRLKAVEVGTTEVAFDSDQASAKEIMAAVDRLGFSARVASK